MYISLFPEQLQEKIEELGFETRHDDYARLADYISLMWVREEDIEEALAKHLPQWISDEDDHYYGQHDTPAEFAEYFYTNYETEYRIPPYVAVDWQATWDANLRHDFYHSNMTGSVWADIW